jgi:hypothetical protein
MLPCQVLAQGAHGCDVDSTPITLISLKSEGNHHESHETDFIVVCAGTGRNFTIIILWGMH